MKSLFGDVDVAKFMMGERAFHIPINFIAQQTDIEGNKVAGVWQTTHGKPLFPITNEFTHVLTLGDMIFRPRLMIASNAFQGSGMSHLAMNGFAEVETWITKGKILLPPLVE